jgi:hypothetical protein
MPNHRTIKGSTLRTILSQAGISRDDLAWSLYALCLHWFVTSVVKIGSKIPSPNAWNKRLTMLENVTAK